MPLTNLDFKLHFYPWQVEPDYVMPPYSVVLTAEMIHYFKSLRAEHGIELTHEQMAWYANMYESQGPDDMWSEYPSHIDECFNA
jgi:hypothetical protein